MMINVKKLVLVGLLASSSLCSAGISDWFWGGAQQSDEQIREKFLDATREFNSQVEAAHFILFTPLKKIFEYNIFELTNIAENSADKTPAKMKAALSALLTALNKKPEAIETQDIAVSEKAKKITEKEKLNQDFKFEYSFNEGLKKCRQKHPDQKEKCNQLYKELARQLFSQAKFKEMFNDFT